MHVAAPKVLPHFWATCISPLPAREKGHFLKTVFVLNGPNLNMLGKREPGIYGTKTLDDIGADCRQAAVPLGLEVDFRQTNNEGDLVSWLQEAGEKAKGVVLNAIHDAVRAIAPVPVVEVHLSNIHAREPFRHVSRIAPHALGMICGFGPIGYTLALQVLAARV
jgi:3-dehydroquinate dehydratase-2